MDNLISSLKENNNTYFNTENGALLNGDCLDKLRELPAKSINLAIYDAPYFSTGIKEVGDKQWKKEEDYIDWCMEVITETQRVLKDNGGFYWFHNNINIMTEILYKMKHDTNFKLKNQITWDKLATGNQDFLMPLYKNSKMKRRYATSLTEYVYYFTFQEGTGLDDIMLNKDNFKSLRDYSKNIMKYIGLKLKEINNTLGHRRSEHFFYHSSTQWDLCTEEIYNELILTFNIDNYEGFITYDKLKQEYDDFRLNYEKTRYIFKQPYLLTPKDIEESKNMIRPYSTVWHYAREEDIYKTHLTPKPLDMIKHIIETNSNEGDIILDCFTGSGTTPMACEELHREWICIEKEIEFCETTKNRIIHKII